MQLHLGDGSALPMRRSWTVLDALALIQCVRTGERINHTGISNTPFVVCRGFTMLATKTLVDRMATLLAGDTTTLAAVGLVNVHLAKAPFTPGPVLVPGDFTEADFDGYAALAVDSATAQVFTDPSTGDKIIQLDEPAGGWHWETTGVTNLPQTIYGAWLTDPTDATVYGSMLLDIQPELSGTDQGVDLPQVRFRLNQQALT